MRNMAFTRQTSCGHTRNVVSGDRQRDRVSRQGGEGTQSLDQCHVVRTIRRQESILTQGLLQHTTNTPHR